MSEGPRARVALATCAQLPEGDDDERLLPPALSALGIDARFAVWDDPGVAWTEFDLVVVRSTWDYAPRRDAFLTWADGVPRLANPLAVLRWNTDKRYLDDLAAAGLPIVPTAFVSPGGARPPLRGEVVVKPAISAGARGAARFGAGRHPEAHAHLEALGRAGETAMVQPYVRSVDERGETALLYFDGEFSHAVRKGPILRRGPAASGPEHLVAGLFAGEEISAREPAAAERALGDAVVDHLTRRFGALLYARVDVVDGPAGTPLVLEVEATEPSLFLRHGNGAAERMAQAVARRV